MLDILARVPGSGLRLAKRVGPLVLSSTYRGTTACQQNQLWHVTAHGTVEVALPVRFQGGEAALCHGDTVRLATLDGTPVLVEEQSGPGDADLDMAARNGDGWAPSCRLSLTTVPRYRIAEQFCRGAACRALRRIAPALAETEEVPPSLRQPELRPDDKAIALRAMNGQDLPTLGQDAATDRIHGFWDNHYAVLPIDLNGHGFVGKLGAAGFGEHYGSTKLLAIYRVVGDHAEPVAGFALDVAGRSLSGATAAASPE